MMKPMPRIAVMFAVLSLALVVGGVGALYLTDKTVRDAAKTAMAPAVGGPFSLIDHKGRAVTDSDYRGKLMLVYFGYTSCPDICPTGLHKISQALDALGEDAVRVQPLFIMMDPERDTVEAMADYVGQFHTDLIEDVKALLDTGEDIHKSRTLHGSVAVSGGALGKTAACHCAGSVITVSV